MLAALKASGALNSPATAPQSAPEAASSEMAPEFAQAAVSVGVSRQRLILWINREKERELGMARVVWR